MVYVGVAPPKAGSADNIHCQVAKHTPNVDLLFLGSSLAQTLDQTVSATVHEICIPIEALVKKSWLPSVSQASMVCPAVMQSCSHLNSCREVQTFLTCMHGRQTAFSDW